MRASLRLLLLATLVTGCAGGGGGDAGSLDDGGAPPRDAGRRDSGGGACPAGQHRCGAGCIDDLPNEPENGCRTGCGEPCPTPPAGEAACDESGACTFACPPPFHREGTECVCTARTCAELGFMCGAPDDGCGGTLDCGSCSGDATCIDGRCACTPDEREPNDSPLAVMGTSVATIPEANEWDMTFTSWNLHDASDEDWFRFEVIDTGLDNPTITVTLAGIPDGSDYGLTVYYVCDVGGDLSTCTLGSPCSGSASGTTPETVRVDVDCDRIGFNDSGALWIRVHSVRWRGSCAPYSLRVRSES